MATKHEVFAALQAHFAQHVAAPTQEELANALQSHWLAVKQHLFRLKGEGAVTWESGDFSTLRLAASKASKADKNTPKVTKVTRAAKPKVAAPVADVSSSTASTGIEAARGATIDDGSIEMFKGWSADLRARIEADLKLANEIDAMVAALEGLPRLGARGALIFELLSKANG